MIDRRAPNNPFDRYHGQSLFIAHRGYRACYPENTLCAFAASLGHFAMVELDVQLSADGLAVVFHDQMLDRTSNAILVAAELGLQTLAAHDWHFVQLSQLDVGSWFVADDPFGAIRQGLVERSHLLGCMPQRLPSLLRVLSWAVHSDMPLNIELKDMGTSRLNDALVAEVVRDITTAGADHLVVLSSFNHTILRICHWLAPNLAIAALQEGFHPPDLISYLHSLAVCAYHPADQIVDASLIHAIRSAGFRINVFTVNDPVRQRKLFAAGVTGIFTDYIGKS